MAKRIPYHIIFLKRRLRKVILIIVNVKDLVVKLLFTYEIVYTAIIRLLGSGFPKEGTKARRLIIVFKSFPKIEYKRHELMEKYQRLPIREPERNHTYFLYRLAFLAITPCLRNHRPAYHTPSIKVRGKLHNILLIKEIIIKRGLTRDKLDIIKKYKEIFLYYNYYIIIKVIIKNKTKLRLSKNKVQIKKESKINIKVKDKVNIKINIKIDIKVKIRIKIKVKVRVKVKV
ncbi:hypothetical protein B0H67DRAFT_555983 [Lasiosphaeris hirsuta]|uniref:Ribosomal protein S7 n=1 Tax=Lasiosphaeris hirsuta TaxID=260670 RepID=A0AA40AA96_9PEZI|nr:hypothetical protein B0H67DRAFT_555983 [Lasiosphaeris hirsuta]